MARGTCRCCGNEYSVNADGTIRYHIAADPECQDASDENSRKCRGVGQRPAGDDPVPAGDLAGYVCRVPAGPTGCGKAVQLTANNRARSHLDPQGQPCAGGSDWPIEVDTRGNRRDTAPAALFDPRDPDGPGEPPSDDPVECACNLQWRSTVAMRAAGHDDMDCEGAPVTRADRDQVEPPVFDVTHVVTADLGPEVHPGEAGDCELPDCCTHPRGFEYADDDNGHSGSFCPVCGTEEDMRPPAPDDWHCPPDILERMPEEVQRTAALNPECWECGHEVTPLAERFEPDGSVVKVAWTCSAAGVGRRCPDTCGVTYSCRPQLSYQDRLGNLTEGALFVRHMAKAPLDRLVYRVQKVRPDSLDATVVSAGQHAGRTGTLTNLYEEITCTDLDGRPRPRRDVPAPGTSALAAPSPTSDGPLGPSDRSATDRPTERPSTPSRPAPTTPAPGAITAPRSRPSSTASAPSPSAPVAASSTPGTTSGPTETAAGSTASARKRTDVADAFSTPKETVKDSDKYDRYGRYKLLHPSSPKKKVAWTRATTFAKSVQDTFALSQWAQRMTLKGATLRPDIVAAAGTLDVRDDKDRLNDLVEDAKRAAGDKVAANLGTAVHSYTEHRDKGTDVDIPEEHLPTVDAYEAVLKEFGLEPVPGLIEFTTAVMQFEIAGTSDRCYRVTRDITIDLNGRPVTLYAGEYVIGDVKTGADLSYGWQEIAIQLAIYAQGLNTSGVWSWETRTWSRPEDPTQPGVQIQVRTDVGVVPHLPVDRTRTGAPLATLYAVDLTAGWAACVLCGQVRDWRKSSKLATPLKVADLAAEPARPAAPAAASRPPEAPAKAEVSARPPTLQERAQAVRNKAEASAVFQAAVAQKIARAELDKLIGVMQRKLESHVEQGA